jgi:putative oxygen-independent coproporphyrinogen III oxidase
MTFGIYVHWPFCAAKCPYCDFNSHVRGTLDESGWIAGIEKELDWTAEAQGDDRPLVETIFFGGGTPSLMSGKAVGRLLDKISRNWRVANDIEITLESNPASADAARFADYKAAGVGRLSLGMQALNDADLKALGRLHNAQEARAALELAMAHFPRVSLDLIYARPGQTVAGWRAELARALSFGTDHLSLYQLTIEPQTPFALLHKSGALKIPGEESAAELYEITQEMTEAAGLPAYEISNHARPGSESRHNLIYWRYGDYAGVGPGAHGRLTVGDTRIATKAERLPEKWFKLVERHGYAFEYEEISLAEAARENLLMALRLSEGLDLDAYQARWNVELPKLQIATLEEAGIVTLQGAHLAATKRGRLVLNTLLAEIAV